MSVCYTVLNLVSKSREEDADKAAELCMCHPAVTVYSWSNSNLLWSIHQQLVDLSFATKNAYPIVDVQEKLRFIWEYI